LRKTIIISVAFCWLVIIGASIAIEPIKLDVLNSYKGNLSLEDKELHLLNMIQVLGGISGLAGAEVVKFKAPKADWTLKKIEFLLYDGYNGTRKSVPTPQVIAFEIRDKNFNLLYRYADIQLPYTNFLMNITDPVPATFDLPSIKVGDEFYVLFFDRGAVRVMAKFNSTGNSSFYDPLTGRLYKAELISKHNNTIPLNWIMNVGGI
jgi:hypothetical protein